MLPNGVVKNIANENIIQVLLPNVNLSSIDYVIL